jgi:hypothetical protein
MPRPRREPTENVRAKSRNVAKVRDLANTEQRSLVDQLDIVIEAGLSSMGLD